MTELAGKSLICTGAGSGIGRATALLAARKGARVVIADVNEHGGQETVAMIRNEGGEATFVRTNIADEQDVEKMVQLAVEKYGRLDCAFNNAAVPQVSKKAHELTASEWERQMAVTLNGTFFCLKHEVAAMLQTGGGSIVNTSSGAGITGFPLGVEYSAAKFGVVGLTRTAALDYAGDKIRINHVSPGAIRTPMLQSAMDKDPNLEPYIASTNPMKRLAGPGEVGEGVVWLLSDAASFVTGTCLAVDGGYLA